MAVEGSTQALLVEVVTNETDAPSKDEEAIQNTDLRDIFSQLTVLHYK